MNPLDKKINAHFAGLVVRKDLIKAVKGNAIVPSYVLEYLLGQYCATDDEASITSGIDTVREILRKHYVHRNEAELVRSIIHEKGRHKVIDRITVSFNDKKGAHEAEFANLGIKQVLIDSEVVRKHQKLLVGGVWCIADVQYAYTEENGVSPWILGSLKPIQISRFDMDNYVATRQQFSTSEWIDLLIQSIGFNPAMFDRRDKLIQLTRLIPFCERNYNLIELGPKGTGKSHIYSEFSPHGILISGGEITVAKLFVNNSNGKIGLVGYWDVVAFDEFAGKKKRSDKALVDIMKNYMANKSFSRGIEALGAEASMVFVGNTDHTVPYMLKHSDLFDPLPEAFHDSAFLDRLHSYIPGWEVDVIRGEMFCNGYGFVVDYLAEILRSLRDHDYSDRYRDSFTLSDDISTRDRDAIRKTFSGLMKLLFPSGEASVEEIKELLHYAIEGRKRIKDQLLRIDSTYPLVRFAYVDRQGREYVVSTLEGDEYPAQYRGKLSVEPLIANSSDDPEGEVVPLVNGNGVVGSKHALQEQRITVQENQRGISFDKLLGPYLAGANRIVITDAGLQPRNLMELLETVSRLHDPSDALAVHVVTVEATDSLGSLCESLEKISDACKTIGIELTWEFAQTGALHDCNITTDHGWKIESDCGLDIFQQNEHQDMFSFANRMQQHRQCRSFNMMFQRCS